MPSGLWQRALFASARSRTTPCSGCAARTACPDRSMSAATKEIDQRRMDSSPLRPKWPLEMLPRQEAPWTDPEQVEEPGLLGIGVGPGSTPRPRRAGPDPWTLPVRDPVRGRKLLSQSLDFGSVLIDAGLSPGR